MPLQHGQECRNAPVRRTHRRDLLVLSWLVTTGIAFAQAPDTERRVALVIGTLHANDRLANAGNDATLIADTLQHLGLGDAPPRRAARPCGGEQMAHSGCC